MKWLTIDGDILREERYTIYKIQTTQSKSFYINFSNLAQFLQPIQIR